jgi:glutathione synthase/RimK-type ligase-like ATP-grasp enzyme
VGGIGNVPFEHLLPAQRFGRVKCMVDYAPEDMSAALVGAPRHHVVFNAIGDPDVIAADDERLLRVLGFSSRRILNPPHAVARTRRDRLPALLQGIADVLVPQVWRVEVQAAGAQALADSLEQSGAHYPLILRPAASHGGAEVVLATDRATVEQSELLSKAPGDADVAYATAYHEYRSADGYYRKYRMIFVEGRPYPYHLAVSRHWLVHYFSADMQEDWKLEEERRFLEHPAEALGERAIRAIEAIGQRLGLDYAGIDFAILNDGGVLVFEANATMLVHPERHNGPFAYKNRAVTAITNAFQRMIVRFAGTGSF